MGRMVAVAVTTVIVSMLVAGVASAGSLNVIEGDSGPNDLTGTQLRDAIRGLGDDDRLRGFAGRDRLDGGEGDDWMRGNTGDDRMRGEAGADFAYGNAGDDLITGGDGEDEIYGGRGDDLILSIGDNAKDVVDCGPGVDTVDRSLVLGPDQKDAFVNCERSSG